MATLVVPAAGEGSRLERGRPKALVDLVGRPLIDWVLSAASGLVDHLIVVIQPQEQHAFEEWAARAALPADLTWAFQEAPEGSLAAVRIGVERARDVGKLASGLVVVWADQVGVAAGTIQAVAESVATDTKELAVPLSETSSPYVWLELDESGLIAQVMRVRDGDISPPVGLADLGIFGLSESLARAFLDVAENALGEDAEREPDFTYVLPTLSALADTTFLPRVAAGRQLIAVNTPADLARARRVLGEGR